VGGYIYCLSCDGIEKWKLDTGGPIFSSPCLLPADCVVIGTHAKALYCLRQQSGEICWKVPTEAAVFASPCCGTTVLVLLVCDITGLDCVIAVSIDGTVLCLDMQHGDMIKKYCLPGEVFSSPVMLADGRVIVGCRDNYLYCLN